MRTNIFGGLAFLALAATVSATPTGLLTVNGCGGAQVQVTLTAVDWEPLGGPTGCVETGSGTNVSYSGGVMSGAGIQGAIKDLPAGPLPVPDFMANFAGHGTLHFDLDGIGPGVANTTCTNAPNSTCSVFAGSPFVIFTDNNGQVSVVLRAFGTARDSSGVDSTWDGNFNAPFGSSQTASQIQATILAGNPITSTYAGRFDITFTEIPEPASIALMGLGLMVVGLVRRRAV